jgi:hypothetical protein
MLAAQNTLMQLGIVGGALAATGGLALAGPPVLSGVAGAASVVVRAAFHAAVRDHEPAA